MNKRIRHIVFGARSALPASAACVVANGLRETLASLLGVPVEVALSEPAIPDASAWLHIVRDAKLYRVTGAVADAAVVLRCNDALALAAALFGEPAQPPIARELSPIENDVLDRTVRAMASHLGAVCGARDTNVVERIESLERFSTYFEVFIESPLCARVGIALSRDPQPAPRERFDLAHLADVPLRMRATMELGALSGGEAAALRAGAYVSLTAGAMQRCALRAGDRLLVRGSCGVRDGHYAITVSSV
jgi:flagellar motor switch protein FliM